MAEFAARGAGRIYFDQPECDAMVPVAQQIVGAVRDGDAGPMLDLLAQAAQVGGVQWRFVLIVTLAAMVPDDLPPRRLLAWMDRDPL
ncbi:hypothetical protein ACFQNE_01965 [Gordonia phosphorivorans]|uniref:TetR family transcriptional regulator n=1 Tax=Gordonia phosphorivorans TaxID=1056982 RepID=A0ABV6H7D1_9ACTN